MNRRISALLLLTAASLAAACASSDGLDGRDSITRIDDEPPGPNCVEGGVLVRTGLDENSDGVLQGDEVSSESILCNGSDGEQGATYLTSTTSEPIGANCSNGGARVDVGPDTNGNGELDTDEVVATEYVCNGADGAQGPAGPTGPAGADGTDGTNGTDGADGSDALVAVVDEPAGANCADGGLRVTSGPDSNDSGVLDAAEVDTTRYVCDGADGMNGTGGGSPAEVYTSYDSGSVITSGFSTFTVGSISFSTTGPGTAYVVGSIDVYCSPTNCSSSSSTRGDLTLADNATANADTGAHSYFFLTEDRTENMTRTAVFNVASSGTQNFYMRGSADSGVIGFYRPQITVIFFPN